MDGYSADRTGGGIMNVTVNEQPQLFYLAGKNKWMTGAGHGIMVGEYHFCAIPFRGCINITEVTSGAKVVEIPIDTNIHMLTQTKKGTLRFFEAVGEMLITTIESTPNFDKEIQRLKGIAFETLGEMPTADIWRDVNE